MNKQKKTRILIIGGILVLSFSQIASHFLEISDVAKGLWMGIGIGLLVVALVVGKNRQVN